MRRRQQIADSVNIELELGRRHFPVFTLPEGQTSEQYLRELCLAGLKERYADRPDRISGQGIVVRGQWPAGQRGKRQSGSGIMFCGSSVAPSPIALRPSPLLETSIPES